MICIAGYWYQRHDTNCVDPKNEDNCSDESSIEAYSLSSEEPTIIQIKPEPSQQPAQDVLAEEDSDDLYSDSNAHICEICSDIFDDEDELMEHQRQCRKRGTQKPRLQKPRPVAGHASKAVVIEKPKKTTSIEEPKVFSCALCSETFESKWALSFHAQKMHIGNRVSCDGQCSIVGCSRIFANQEKLDRHVSVHQLLTCDICQKQVQGKACMRGHLKSHRPKPAERFSCPICNEEFNAHYRFECHMQVHGGKSSFKCQYDGCGRLFRYQRKFDEHTEVHEKLLNDPAARALYCKTCDKLMQTPSLFERHKCLKFICYFCGKVYKRMSLLKEHLNSHTGAKPYECTVCKKSFARYYNLRRHSMIHSGKKPYVCSECGHAFNQTIELHRHRFKVHGIFKHRYPCTFCDQVFPENALLRRHLKTHAI